MLVGAEVLAADGFASLAGHNVAVVLNQASMVDDRHLLDVMVNAGGFELSAVYSPEHGVRGDLPAGQGVGDIIDPVTGLDVYSLYDPQHAEHGRDLPADVDVVVFDLQDVGTRVYTYISTMGTAMMMAAEADARFMVLDRPNPLGGQLVGGPIRAEPFSSFVGRYPVPFVHGMTTGELALAIKAEGWLPGLDHLELEVVPMGGWTRGTRWPDTGRNWVAPSPSLPTAASAVVYPATVLFEATTWSVGRGTDQPFSVVGAPGIDAERLAQRLNAHRLAGVRFVPTQFTPQPSDSVPNPKHQGATVHGVRLDVTDATLFSPYTTAVHLLAEAGTATTAAGPESSGDQTGDPPFSPALIDRPAFFDLLAGNAELRQNLERGAGPNQIVADAGPDEAQFLMLRSPYLLYD